MDLKKLEKHGDFEWHLPRRGKMRVPGIIYGSEELVGGMDDKVHEQVANVAMLPGIVTASYAMPDAHWGYGFPIGGVAAFDPDDGGVISAGGVGFDISCGVRALRTGLEVEDLEPDKKVLADALFQTVPAGVGSRGKLHLDDEEMDAMLCGGARWAVDRGYGRTEDLEYTEEHGCIAGALPAKVSGRAKQRQCEEMGTLGSGNHYLEVQKVAEVYDDSAAAVLGLATDDVVVSIHCGSRGLGHQIGSDYLKRMAVAAAGFGIDLPDRELACAPLHSDLGRDYQGAMRAGINCALANRQIITELVRRVFADLFPGVSLDLVYDVSHNTCKEERHEVEGREKRLFVHRKGATRAFGPGNPDVPQKFRDVGQPVLIGGTMGTASHVLVGTRVSMSAAFGSACHGAGRRMSRHQAKKRWHGRDIVRYLAEQGIIIRSPSYRGVAEEAPGAYKDVDAVAEAAEQAGLAKRVVRLEPMVCVKG